MSTMAEVLEAMEEATEGAMEVTTMAMVEAMEATEDIAVMAATAISVKHHSSL